MKDMTACDWEMDGGGFTAICGHPATQWVVHIDGGNINVHCDFHTIKMNQDITDEGWLELTYEEAVVLDIMRS